MIGQTYGRNAKYAIFALLALNPLIVPTPTFSDKIALIAIGGWQTGTIVKRR